METLSNRRMVTMYYKKQENIPALPEDIKQECIKVAEEYLATQPGAWYRRYETENKNSVAYIEDISELSESEDRKSGGVGFYSLPPYLVEKICNFYKDVDHPAVKHTGYQIQVVIGGQFVAPHIDDSNVRTSGFLYLLKTGGENVRTVWYEVKPEYKNLELSEYSGIPYSRLDVAEDNCLEEDCWHWMNFNKIHSVENQESLRISLWGYGS